MKSQLVDILFCCDTNGLWKYLVLLSTSTLSNNQISSWCLLGLDDDKLSTNCSCWLSAILLMITLPILGTLLLWYWHSISHQTWDLLCFCIYHECLSFLQCVIDHQALPCLLNLLTTNHKKSIKKEACWTISNITAGNREQIQVCMRWSFVDKLNIYNSAKCSIPYWFVF